jgi:hypothetical protein
MCTAPCSKEEGSEEVAYLDHIRYSTFGGTSGSMASVATTAVCFEEHIRHYKKKPQKPDNNHAYEGLLSLLQGMLRRMDSMSNTRSHLPQVHQG